MGVHMSACYMGTSVSHYTKARRHLLELFISIDKMLPDGPKKEEILNNLVDMDTDVVHVFVRG